MHVVLFHALGELFAVPVAAVREVVREAVRRRVPSAVPWIAGVADVRGEMLALVDLGARLGRSASGTRSVIAAHHAGCSPRPA